MKNSLVRAKQSRQIYMNTIYFAVDGASVTPVASGLDALFVDNVEDVSTGKYKITLIDKAQRNLIPGSIVSATASRVHEIVAVDETSITVQFRNLSGVAADADFNISLEFHNSKHLF